jgi:hypothetical protein
MFLFVTAHSKAMVDGFKAPLGSRKLSTPRNKEQVTTLKLLF